MLRFVAVALATILFSTTLPVRVGAVEPNGDAGSSNVLRLAFGNEGDKDDSGPPLQLRNAGTVEGQVVGVDYKTGLLTLQAGRTRYDVLILPSTNIQGGEKAGFRTIADIARGSKVQILMSKRGSQYIAQMIRLR